MLEMLGDIAIGLVLFVVGMLLIIIGIPRHGESPRFLRFEASLVLYPAVVMGVEAFGERMTLRGCSDFICSKWASNITDCAT